MDRLTNVPTDGQTMTDVPTENGRQTDRPTEMKDIQIDRLTKKEDRHTGLPIERRDTRDRNTHRLTKRKEKKNQTNGRGLPSTKQENPRCHGHFHCQSTPCDIYRYSVLFCWKMHSGMSLSFSSERVELFRRSCYTKKKNIYMLSSFTSRTVTLHQPSR